MSSIAANMSDSENNAKPGSEPRRNLIAVPQRKRVVRHLTDNGAERGKQHQLNQSPEAATRMFNNYGPRQNPRYVTGTNITQALSRPEIELGALEPLRDFCFCTDGVRGHLTVAAHGKPGDLYVYGQGKNISMADWCETDPARGPRRRASGATTATS